MERLQHRNVYREDYTNGRNTARHSFTRARHSIHKDETQDYVKQIEKWRPKVSLGDDEVIPCGCGFDDVSYPHSCKPKTTHDFANERVVYRKPTGLIKKLHEIVGMAHAGGIVAEDLVIEELFFKIETEIDELIEGLEDEFK